MLHWICGLPRLSHPLGTLLLSPARSTRPILVAFYSMLKIEQLSIHQACVK